MKKIARIIASTVATLVMGLAPWGANASLIGTTVDISSVHGSCLNVVVGSGVECNIFDTASRNDDVIRIDLSDAAIVVAIEELSNNGGIFWTTSPTAFDIVISGLPAIDSIVTTLETFGLPLFSPAGNAEPTAALTGLTEITYSHNNVDVSCGLQVCRRLTVDIALQSVPESGTLALLGLGLAALAASRRRSQ